MLKRTHSANDVLGKLEASIAQPKDILLLEINTEQLPTDVRSLPFPVSLYTHYNRSPFIRNFDNGNV